MKYIKIGVPDDFDPESNDIYYQKVGKDAEDENGNRIAPPVLTETWQPEYRQVLDKGFLGLVDYMGGDDTVVNAARVSYGSGTKRSREDRALIRYLIRNRHWSPIEMVEVMWHVKAPMFVFRQWHRHRMASINEYSARYSELSNDFYMPDIDVMKPQSTTNKQGRDGEMSEDNAYACQLQIQHAYQEAFQAYQYLRGSTNTPSMALRKRKELVEDHAMDLIKRLGNTNDEWNPKLVTHEMIDAKMEECARASGTMFTNEEFREDGGLSRELARMVMPVATYSEMYWKSDLRNTFNFIGLRSDPHAQWEIRTYSDTMLEMIRPIAPTCVEAFIDYQMEGRSLSRMEVDAARILYRMMIDADGDTPPVDGIIEVSMKQAGASDREIREFLTTLKGAT